MLCAFAPHPLSAPLHEMERGPGGEVKSVDLSFDLNSDDKVFFAQKPLTYYYFLFL